MVPQLTDNVDWLNAILNHPTVKPWVAGPLRGPLDFSDVLSAPGTICYGTTGAAFLYRHRGEGIFEVSVAALPFERGPGLVEAFKANIAEIFHTHHEAKALYAQVPEANTHATKLAAEAGFKPIGVHGAWQVRSKVSPMHHYALLRPTSES